LEGDHVFALPYASCLSTFQAPGWGISAVFPPRRWRNATPWELEPFSHRSASRIFIMQPGCTPRRRSPKTVTTSPWVGRSKPGCDLGPTLSFKDVHHPRWGGGRAEPELYLPRGFVGHPLLRRSRERALAGPSGGSDFDNAGPVDGRRRLPQRVGLVGLARGAPSCQKAAAAPCAREDRPRCRALLGRATVSRPSVFCCSAGPPIEWGCSYLRRWNRSSVCNGTLNASVFVHCGCRGLNMYVFLARSRVFSSFSSTKTRLLVVCTASPSMSRPV
jgi:hypothetical protein